MIILCRFQGNRIISLDKRFIILNKFLGILHFEIFLLDLAKTIRFLEVIKG